MYSIACVRRDWMKLILLFCCVGWLKLFTPNVIAKPSVYCGAFAFGSGDWNTLAKQQTIATWVWSVNFVSPSFAPIDQLYPGDNYVDWISVDGYNRLANSWQDFSVLAAPTVTELTNIAPGKPIMVAETGCNQNTNYDKS